MKELNWKEVASRLKALRKQNHLTIEKLAEMVNVSTSFIGLIEKGESGVSLENLYKLAQIYGCSLDYLVAGEDSENRAVDSPMSMVGTALHGCNDEEIVFFADLARFLRRKLTAK